jgi:hypothetical protein
LIASPSARVPGGPKTRSGRLRGAFQPAKARSSRPTVFSGARLVSSTVSGCATGIAQWRSASATPRPASTSTTRAPSPTAVAGPRRSGFSFAPPVPTSTIAARS